MRGVEGSRWLWQPRTLCGARKFSEGAHMVFASLSRNWEPIRMIQRKKPIARSTKPIPRRRARPRRGPMRCPEYRAWLRERRCAAAIITERDCAGPIDAAHTENNGLSSKGPDSSCAPLCRSHHKKYDSGRKAFELKYKVDMQKLAAAHWLAYRMERGEL